MRVVRVHPRTCKPWAVHTYGSTGSQGHLHPNPPHWHTPCCSTSSPPQKHTNAHAHTTHTHLLLGREGLGIAQLPLQVHLLAHLVVLGRWQWAVLVVLAGGNGYGYPVIGGCSGIGATSSLIHARTHQLGQLGRELLQLLLRERAIALQVAARGLRGVRTHHSAWVRVSAQQQCAL